MKINQILAFIILFSFVNFSFTKDSKEYTICFINNKDNTSEAGPARLGILMNNQLDTSCQILKFKYSIKSAEEKKEFTNNTERINPHLLSILGNLNQEDKGMLFIYSMQVKKGNKKFYIFDEPMDVVSIKACYE